MENNDHGEMTDLGNGYFKCEICGHEILFKNKKVKVIVEGNLNAKHTGSVGDIHLVHIEIKQADDRLKPFEDFLNTLEDK